jgi:hypothetical protein
MKGDRQGSTTDSKPQNKSRIVTLQSMKSCSPKPASFKISHFAPESSYVFLHQFGPFA